MVPRFAGGGFIGLAVAAVLIAVRFGFIGDRECIFFSATSPNNSQAGRALEGADGGAGFAGGTLFFVVARAELSLGLICLGMAWAVACMQNCLVIAGWDRDEDVAMDQPSLARELSGLHYWMLIGLLVQLALVGLAVWSDWARLKLGVALLLSGALLGELERRGMHWPTEQRRVWADAILLFPLLTLV